MAINPLVAGLLKNALIGGAFSAGAIGLERAFGGKSPEEEAAEIKREKEKAAEEFQRQRILKADENRYAMEQIRLQTGASEAQAAALLEQLKGANELQAKIALANLDPRLYAERAAIDQANWERSQELNRIAGMEQTRELTRRKIEGDVIGAWRGITEAQINRDATLGLGMMQLAYTAGMPNPNILQGGAALAGQGRSSFGTPSSTIS